MDLYQELDQIRKEMQQIETQLQSLNVRWAELVARKDAIRGELFAEKFGMKQGAELMPINALRAYLSPLVPEPVLNEYMNAPVLYAARELGDELIFVTAYKGVIGIGVPIEVVKQMREVWEEQNIPRAMPRGE